MPVHAHGNRQIQMTKCAIGKGHIDKPAIGTETLQVAGLNLDKIAAQEPRCIHKMASMGQHVILLKVLFRIAGRLSRGGAFDDQRLHRICHRIAVR